MSRTAEAAAAVPVTASTVRRHFLYHHRTAGRGAEGNHIMSLVRALEAGGHTVEIVSPPGVDPRQTAGAVPLDKGAGKQHGIGALWKWISCHAPQFLFELAELGYNAYAALRLIPLLRRNRTAAYYERYAFFVFAGVLLARWYRLPTILEVNEITGIARARKQGFVRLARWIERLVFRKADRIVTVSSFLREQVIARGARPEAVALIPNAIDPARFATRGIGDPIRSARGIDRDATVFGFVGWFDEWDRLDRLVEVFAHLSQTNPSLRLMLVGDGPVAGALREQVERLGISDRVVMTGPVPRAEVPAYIDAMDVCVLPDSNRYGSPMVLIEFMAMGKAVIAPDLPPIRDVVRDGETGRIVPAGVEALRQAMEEFATDAALPSQLGERARSEILATRTWTATARRVLDFVPAILGEKGK